MTKRAGRPLQNSDSGVTYSTGLGFVPGDLAPAVPRQIRRMSNIICGVLLLYFLCREIFSLPFTYIGYLLGLDITINQSTHLILMGESARLIVDLLVQGTSLLVVFLVFRFAFYRPLAAAHLFRRPNAGILPVALPILTAVGILAVILADAFGKLTRLCGIVLDPVPDPVTELSGLSLLSLASVLVCALLEELIFRGVILTPLRKFGDGFAVAASALVCGILADGFVAGIAAFLYGLAAGYFVIRSGSVSTALAGRASLLLCLFVLRAVRGMLEAPLADILLLGAILLLVIGAMLACRRFVRLDANAFRLLPAEIPLSAGQCVAAFCAGIFFVVQIGMLLYRVIHNLQIIGW